MELTYTSIVLLGCFFLDWFLLASAEEGESPVSLFKCCLDLFSVVTWLRDMSNWYYILNLTLMECRKTTKMYSSVFHARVRRNIT